MKRSSKVYYNFNLKGPFFNDLIDLIEQDYNRPTKNFIVDNIQLDFPSNSTQKMHEIKVDFYGLTNIVSDIGGFSKGLTGIFFIIFGSYIYRSFILELAKESDIEYVKEKLSFNEYLKVFEKVDQIEKDMKEMREQLQR